jgi:hypothetical protein
VAAVRKPEDIEALLQREAIGRTVLAVEVHGINSLKSVSPGLAAVAGQAVEQVETNAKGHIVITIGNVHAVVDLQRAAAVQFQRQLSPWTFAEGPQPTIRVLFTDGTGVDFKEASRTKRITLTLLAN